MPKINDTQRNQIHADAKVLYDTIRNSLDKVVYLNSPDTQIQIANPYVDKYAALFPNDKNISYNVNQWKKATRIAKENNISDLPVVDPHESIIWNAFLVKTAKYELLKQKIYDYSLAPDYQKYPLVKQQLNDLIAAFIAKYPLFKAFQIDKSILFFAHANRKFEYSLIDKSQLRKIINKTINFYNAYSIADDDYELARAQHFCVDISYNAQRNTFKF